MHGFLSLLAVCALLVLCVVSAEPLYGPERITHVTLVGCNKQDADQSFWLSAIAPVLAHAYARENEALHTTEDAPSRVPPLTDVLLWTGAATYASVADSGIEASRRARSVADIANTYTQLREAAYYKAFLSYALRAPASGDAPSPSPAGLVLGVMDDRDLGLRGADHTYTQTQEVKKAFLDLLDAPADVRDQAASHAGFYYISVIPTEPENPLFPFFVNRLCTISLDVRTQRSTFKSATPVLLRSFAFHHEQEKLKQARRDASAAAVPSSSSTESVHDAPHGNEEPMDDLLGAEQWQWLEDTVASYVSVHAREDPHDPNSRRPCALTVIASPLQFFLNDDKPNMGWDLYPFSRSRLLALLQRHEASRFLFVSGHADIGELGVMRATSEADHASAGMIRHYEARTPYPSLTGESAKLMPDASHFVVELTSSGLTHAANEAPYLGWLYTSLVGPTLDENTRTHKHPYIRRHIYLDRTTVVERNFATLTLQLSEQGRTWLKGFMGAQHAPVKVDAYVLSKLEDALEVVLQIYSAQPTTETRMAVSKTRRAARGGVSEKEKDTRVAEALLADLKAELAGPRDHSAVPRLPLAQRTLQLSQIASYAGSVERGEAVAPAGLYTASATRDLIPIFYMYNAPGEYPPAKWYAIYWNCEEVPCMPSSALMIVKIVGVLAWAGLLVVVIVTVSCCGYWHKMRLRRWWRKVRGSKVKKD